MQPAESNSYTYVTFRALVDAIVPCTPELSVFGADLAIGGVQLAIHEYMIWEMDHSLTLDLGRYPEVMPLAAPTAGLLNAGAIQLAASGKANYAVPGSVPFASLSPENRIRTLALLENLQVDLGALPPPYRNDGGLVKFVVDFLNRQTMFGNYSEWSAYGTTRLATPTERRLEYFPIGWRQTGYPGVSKGYRAFRGNLLTIVREGGESRIV
ncbi:hypothetical protein [Cohnella cholangitidis]|uniref:Uncharacterized protein n=1 Tax=Cohnella cholangitidis TaxID=2598458 RepID=A0A7G5C3Z4_9BACL|nr:hypothetical protein [Cohnella cholangitidis]QMV43928.1 hypothetical protein FPL14_24200 [Cohnella cholangitidis]